MIRCPHCGSTKVKKSAAIYEQGVSTSLGESGGVSMSSAGRVTTSSHRYSSIRTSKVAEKNSQPSFDAGKIFVVLLVMPIIIVLAIVLGAGLLSIIKITIAIFVVAVVSVIWIGLNPSEQQKRADKDYQNQWYCFQCGELFQWNVN